LAFRRRFALSVYDGVYHRNITGKDEFRPAHVLQIEDVRLHRLKLSVTAQNFDLNLAIFTGFWLQSLYSKEQFSSIVLNEVSLYA
jgi:hypothetical protein